MAFEYDSSDDTVIEWPDEPPSAQCPKCKGWYTIGNFWRRPSLAEYVYGMKQNPALLPNRALMPKIDSVNCYVCNREASIRQYTEPELEQAVRARLISPGQKAREMARREDYISLSRKNAADKRWHTVKAAPWKHATDLLMKHINVMQQQRAYYLKTQPGSPTYNFFARYVDTMRDYVLPRLRASGVDGDRAEPWLTWAQYLAGPVWTNLDSFWAEYVAAKPKRLAKQPYPLILTAPDCLVFNGYEFPDDVRKVKTANLNRGTAPHFEGEK